MSFRDEKVARGEFLEQENADLREKFEKILKKICDKETSQDPDHWTPENYLCGHCAIVSCVAQQLFGGDLLRASLLEFPEFAYMRSHYLNEEKDFTRPQFGDNYPNFEKLETRERSYVLSYPETLKRYKLLAFRLAKELSGDQSIFEDEIYRRCIFAALDSNCQKLWFGCVITHNNKVVYEGCNKKLEALRCMCEPDCIRFNIPSRTESMLGACGHAEEIGLWSVVHSGIPINECDLYIAGISPKYDLLIKNTVEHSCLRCSVQMHYAKVRHIFVPMNNGWAEISTDDALKTALSYATGEKII